MRCEDLWFNEEHSQAPGFVALYHCIMCLGALVRIWEEDTLYGMDRFGWSRMLFNEAQNIITQLGSTTNLEIVQSHYMMV